MKRLRFLATLFALLWSMQLYGQCQETDYVALRALYLSTGGDNWDDNTGWLDSLGFIANPTMPVGTDVDTWYGVTTDVDGCVTCIDMDGWDNCMQGGAGFGNNLNGSLPPELGNLSNLINLILANNQLSGVIPPALGNLNNLIILSLFRNQLSGDIPIELGNLTNLTELSLGANNLSGSIPPEFGNLNNLIYLYLNYNNLSDSIPSELGNLNNLIHLYLNNNNLSDSIPSELGNLNNLIHLYLNNNNLSDSIPPELGSLNNLTWLDLSNNQLSGSIPPELGDLSNLRELHLRSNDLTGSIPPELGSLNNLTWLDLSNNQLSGSIPPELGNLNNLRRLYLHSNELNGSIPVELGRLTELFALNLSLNTLNGTIPDTLGSLNDLVYLGFHSNQLSGNIPPELGNLNINWLEVNDNQLSGCYDTNLSILCNQLTHPNFDGNPDISDGNCFNIPWEDFCAGVSCPSNTDIQITGNTETCPGSTTTLDAGEGTTYIWSPGGESTQSIEAGMGTYTVTATDSGGCVSTGTISVTEATTITQTCDDGDLSTINDMETVLENDNTQICEECAGIPVANPCHEQDYIALRALYLSTGGDSWTNNDGWLDSLGFIANPTMPVGTDVDTWYGVTTDVDGCVIELNLPINELNGNIPSELENLTHLTVLNLHANQLNGSIPLELASLTDLTILNLHANYLSGSIPPELGSLVNLQNLHLYSNQLIGSIPPALGDLSSLTKLDLGYNQLSGNIPSNLGNLGNLDSLLLDLNQLSNIIPTELGNLSNLTFLWLQENNLTGNIPPELGNLSNLTHLGLHDNNLSGSIPPELGDLSNLTSLNLSYNDLSDSIPPDLGNLSNLTSLNLSYNDLSDSIPPDLGNLSNLINLNLANNELCGTIPIQLSNLNNLTGLFLNNNLLCGCYDTNLSILCNQLNVGNISGGNNFDTDWIIFCNDPNASTCTPIPLTINITPTNPSCDDNDGSILLTVTGGICNYTYAWNNGDSIPDPTGLAASTYSVTITDCSGSMLTSSVDLEQTNIEFDNIIPIDANCHGDNTGAIHIETTGNASPFTFVIEGNSIQETATVSPNTHTFTGLSSGTYNVTVTDSLGCTNDTSGIVVSELPPSILIIDSTSDTLCLGDSTNLSASGASTYEWTPATGLSATNIPNPIATPTTTTTYTVNSYTLTNLIFNGDFEQGDTGFSSNYISGLIAGPGHYAILNSPLLIHSLWSDCIDHTTGTGNMMVLDASTNPNQSVWCQTVSVVSNTNYDFSAWLTSLDPRDPANLEFSINGELLGNLALTDNTCNWEEFSTMWNSGVNTTAHICIFNQVTVHIGNDFALDDITFTTPCSVTDSITIYVSEVTATTTQVNVSCFGENDGQINLTTTGGTPPYTYQWDDANGQATEVATGLSAGTYNVTVTDAYGCPATGTANIETETTTLTCDDNNPCTTNDIQTFTVDGAICEPCTGTVDESSCEEACTTTSTCDDGNSCTDNDMQTLAADGSICVPCTGETSCDPGETIILSCDDMDMTTINDSMTVSICDNDVVCIQCMGEIGDCDNASTIIKVPAGIMPDSQDEKFRKFKIENLVDKCEPRLIIFNRWGDPVYKMENYGINGEWWNGTCNIRNCNGEPLPKGTYYYILYLKSGDEIKGSVFIL